MLVFDLVFGADTISRYLLFLTSSYQATVLEFAQLSPTHMWKDCTWLNGIFWLHKDLSDLNAEFEPFSDARGVFRTGVMWWPHL